MFMTIPVTGSTGPRTVTSTEQTQRRGRDGWSQGVGVVASHVCGVRTVVVVSVSAGMVALAVHLSIFLGTQRLCV